MPELKVKKMAASALEYSKILQSRMKKYPKLYHNLTVFLDSLNKMNKRLKGEEEIPMAPLPIYLKGLILALLQLYIVSIEFSIRHLTSH